MPRHAASLPALTAVELEELAAAIAGQLDRLKRVELPPWLADLEVIRGRARRIARLRSLAVAVDEARYSLTGGVDGAPPRTAAPR